MTKQEQLLKPRVKMIAPVPEYSMIEGTIIIQGDDLCFELRPGYKICIEAIRKYPHIYKELKWWQDREKSELPEFIKWDVTHPLYNGDKAIIKVSDCYDVDQTGQWCADWMVPATKEEYLRYKNSLT